MPSPHVFAERTGAAVSGHPGERKGHGGFPLSEQSQAPQPIEGSPLAAGHVVSLCSTATTRHKKTRLRGLFRLSRGAQERTRTSTELPPLAPEASASTNSATWATQERDYAERLCERQYFCEYLQDTPTGW